MINYIVKNLPARIILLILAQITLAGCGIFGENISQEEACADTYVQIVKLTPPEGATIINENCFTGFQPQHSIEFTIPAAQLNEVTNAVGARGLEEWSETLPDNPDAYPANPANMSSFLVATYSDGILFARIVVDTSDPETYRVHYRGSFVD